MIGTAIYVQYLDYLYSQKSYSFEIMIKSAFTSHNAKNCSYKLTKADDVEYIPRGPKYLYKMRLVKEVIISKINSIASVKSTYLNGLQNIRILSDVFQKIKNIFMPANPKQINNRVGQLSWQSFIRDAHLYKKQTLIKSQHY